MALSREPWDRATRRDRGLEREGSPVLFRRIRTAQLGLTREAENAPISRVNAPSDTGQTRVLYGRITGVSRTELLAYLTAGEQTRRRVDNRGRQRI